MSLYQFVKQYTEFKVYGKRVAIPYSIVEDESQRTGSHYGVTTKDRHFAGKGSVSQIRQSLQQTAEQKNFNLQIASSEQVRQFMIEEGIGVDCSGFAYNILDQYLRVKGHKSLDQQILRYPGTLGIIERMILQKNRVRRSSADTLTSHLNTYPVITVSDIREGDLIRLTPMDWRGKHIVVVIKVKPRCIFYAHSSANTVCDGPHVSVIKVVDASKGIEKQHWLEKTKNSQNYGKETLKLVNGDGVRRLKCLHADILR